MSNHTFVGCVDTNFSLLQFQTKLYLINTYALRYDTCHFLFFKEQKTYQLGSQQGAILPTSFGTVFELFKDSVIDASSNNGADPTVSQ